MSLLFPTSQNSSSSIEEVQSNDDSTTLNPPHKDGLWDIQYSSKEDTTGVTSQTTTTNTTLVTRLERPDNIKVVSSCYLSWWQECQSVSLQRSYAVCTSRAGEHDDDFYWAVSFPGFETYTVGDFVVLSPPGDGVAKLLALWRCNSSRRNYASILRYENAYTALADGDARELLLAKNRQPEKVELKLLRRTSISGPKLTCFVGIVRVLDLCGQHITAPINTSDFDFYTYRFINPDGKTATTTLPDNSIVCKKKTDVPDKVKRRRDSAMKTGQNTSEIDKPKRKSRKGSQTEQLATSPKPVTPLDAIPIPSSQSLTSIFDIVQGMATCEETPEDFAPLLGDIPYNKLRQAKKFALNLLRVLDQMLPPDSETYKM